MEAFIPYGKLEGKGSGVYKLEQAYSFGNLKGKGSLEPLGYGVLGFGLLAHGAFGASLSHVGTPHWPVHT